MVEERERAANSIFMFIILLFVDIGLFLISSGSSGSVGKQVSLLCQKVPLGFFGVEIAGASIVIYGHICGSTADGYLKEMTP